MKLLAKSEMWRDGDDAIDGFNGEVEMAKWRTLQKDKKDQTSTPAPYVFTTPYKVTCITVQVYR